MQRSSDRPHVAVSPARDAQEHEEERYMKRRGVLMSPSLSEMQGRVLALLSCQFPGAEGSAVKLYFTLGPSAMVTSSTLHPLGALGCS